MPSDEQFTALRKLRQEAENLLIACTAVAGAGSLVHVAFDHNASRKPTQAEEQLLGKLRAVP